MRGMLALLAVLSCVAADPQATTANGVVEGLSFSSPLQTVNAFLGVPFATPPLGALRFEKTVLPANWTGVRSAKTAPLACNQAGVTNEDCLYLNIIAPSTPPSGAGYPVLVSIHGGAYSSGSAWGADNNSITVASHGVVVVGLQYRLGPLGWCTTGDSVMPGNYGMWDLKMALEWIRDNIAAFGGNPNDVTALGQSAGSQLIDALSISPHTNMLFHKIFGMSGTSRDIFKSDIKASCAARASSLGLTWTDSADLKQQLLEQDPAGLQAGWLIVTDDSFDFMIMDWAFRYDGDFFPADPVVLRAAAPNKPRIYGINELEGCMFMSYVTVNATMNGVLEYFVPAGTPNRNLLQSLLKLNYNVEAQIKEPSAAEKHAAEAIFGERTFVAAQKDVHDYNLAKFGSAYHAWSYVFTWFNPALSAAYPFCSFASHNTDLLYVYGPSAGQANWTTTDQYVHEYMQHALINFVKTGNPNGPGVPFIWPRASPLFPNRHIVASAIPHASNNFFNGRPKKNNDLGHAAGTIQI